MQTICGSFCGLRWKLKRATSAGVDRVCKESAVGNWKAEIADSYGGHDSSCGDGQRPCWFGVNRSSTKFLFKVDDNPGLLLNLSQTIHYFGIVTH